MKSTSYLVLTSMLCILTAQPARAQADVVLHNARIYTVNPAQPEAQALAIRGERILMIGSNEVLLRTYPNADRIDAGGQTVIPGLIDAHAHLMNQGISMLQADLVGTTSQEEVIERLRKRR